MEEIEKTEQGRDKESRAWRK
jgi:hypothetical protein